MPRDLLEGVMVDADEAIRVIRNGKLVGHLDPDVYAEEGSPSELHLTVEVPDAVAEAVDLVTEEDTEEEDSEEWGK